MKEQLDLMKAAGITSMSVYESTLDELSLGGRLNVLSSKEAALLNGAVPDPNANDTYVVFADEAAARMLKPVIVSGFAMYGAEVRSWSLHGQQGLVIPMPLEEAAMKPLDPDPYTLQMLKDSGFQIVFRLSDNRPFDADRLETLLVQLKQYGVRSILFAGDQVTGFADDQKRHTLTAMAEVMNDLGMNVVVIEPLSLKVPQQGIEKLAYLTHYRAVRLHSLLENQSDLDPQTLSDRFVLAVKDRNIRMIYLNASVHKVAEKAVMTNTLHNLYKSLHGPDGAVQRLQAAGYSLGPAEPFHVARPAWFKLLKLVTVIGGVGLIALGISAFAPDLLLGVFLIGLVGSAGLYKLSPSLLVQALALGTGIFASTLAVVMAVQSLRRQTGALPGGSRTIGRSILLFIKASFISLIGVAYTVGLLNNITYSLQLELYRGVSLLHLLPIFLAGVYVLFFAEKSSFPETVRSIRKLLLTNINLLWVVAAGIAGVVLLYYLSRTGNTGNASDVERSFRGALENAMGVRPRTKEFLLAHPIFILGAYLAYQKYRHAAYLFVIGVIGQLSIIDTSAHIHTPLIITLIRIGYGMFFGILVSLLYIAVWHLGIRLWNKWSPIFKE